MCSPETRRAVDKFVAKHGGVPLDHHAIIESALLKHLERAAESRSLQNELKEFMNVIGEAMALHRVASDISAEAKKKLKVALQ